MLITYSLECIEIITTEKLVIKFGCELGKWIWRENAGCWSCSFSDQNTLQTRHMEIAWLGNRWQLDFYATDFDSVQLGTQIVMYWEQLYGKKAYPKDNADQVKQDVETLIDRLNAMSSFL